MLRTVSSFLAGLLLVACDQLDENLLAKVLADVDAKPLRVLPNQLAPLPADTHLTFKEHLRDPFQWVETGAVEPSQSRIHEILEAHALDTLSLVGVLVNAKNSVALVKSNQGLHAIQIGHHIGLHEGLVVKILHDQIEIQEPGVLDEQGTIQRLIMRASK